MVTCRKSRDWLFYYFNRRNVSYQISTRRNGFHKKDCLPPCHSPQKKITFKKFSLIRVKITISWNKYRSKIKWWWSWIALIGCLHYKQPEVLFPEKIIVKKIHHRDLLSCRGGSQSRITEIAITLHHGSTTQSRSSSNKKSHFQKTTI